MDTNKTYSVIGIGIGPFNLGLAALLEPVEGLSSLFFDQTDGFDWHPGLMLNHVTLQVPFLADLVTMADPTSKYSFLNYLKQNERMYKFFIRENFYILRREYNAYCKWVASELPNCKFSHKVVSVEYKDGLYAVTVMNIKTTLTHTYYAEKLALGTGTQPHVPDFINREALPKVIHAGQYLSYKKQILSNSSVSIIGSGQSAAEVFQDILPATEGGLQLNWFTRSNRFFPMEYSKLTLELTSPEYVDYFYNMPADKRKHILNKQNALFKGIDYDLINEIFDTLYEMSVENKSLNVQLRTNMQLNSINPLANGACNLQFSQTEQLETFNCESDFVILATGYKYKEPAFLKAIENRISRMDDGLYQVGRNYTIDKNASEIFVQNAELHTHGFVTPDLGMGAYRNSCIINQLAGREVYFVEKRIAFQEFSVKQINQHQNERLTVPEELAAEIEELK